MCVNIDVFSHLQGVPKMT